jgi:CBS domain-containing protein
MKVKEIMTRDVLTVTKDLSIRRLIKLLDKNKITGAPVVDEQGKLIGVVSSKDVIRAIDHLIRVHVSLDEQKEHKGQYNWVDGLMTTNVVTADEEDDVREVFGTMLRLQIHRVPVVKEGKPVGIISSQDACKIVANVE